MALLFDESYYLNAKLEQLHAKGEMDASGKPYTMESLVKAISDAGLTPYSHYTQYGCREGLDPSSTFDQSYYLASKLAQLRSTGEVDADGNAYTMASLTATLAAQGMSPLQHYLQLGRDEGLNPNAWFNESEYLNAKLAQLHSTGETDANGDPYTLASLRQAISDAGMTPLEHYEQFGHAETNADGTLINPSNAFDANAYVAAKLYQLQTTGSSEEQTAWADKSPADVLAALEDASLSPVSHYVQYGADEANAAGVALVQTVPSEQRVSNDPLRNDLGQNVPSNYNDPTPGPDAAEAAPVTKPADMGGLAAESISPGVVPPEAPVAVPGDDAYVAPTPGTVDTNEAPVVPETDPDSGLLVLPDAEPEPEPEPGTPGGGTSPSDPSFSMNKTEDGISFTGVTDNRISLSVQDGKATFTSGNAVISGVDIVDRPINLENDQTLTADLADLDKLTVTGGTVVGRLEQTTTAASVTKNLDLSGIEHLTGSTSLSVDKNATLTINAAQANDLTTIGEGDVKIDAAKATGGVKVETVAWDGSSNNWHNTRGFDEGQLAAVTGSSGDDFFSLDLADIGTLTVNEADNTVDFAASNDLQLNGGQGTDTLMLTWFAPKGNEGHTLEKLDAAFFEHITGFETIIFNKGNKSNNLQIDASSLGSDDNPVTLMLMSSGTIEGIHRGLVIGFTEPKLNQDVNFQLSATDSDSMLTLDIGTTGDHAINLSSLENISAIEFQGTNITLDGVTITGSSDDGGWKVHLSGVDDGILKLEGNILTIKEATEV